MSNKKTAIFIAIIFVAFLVMIPVSYFMGKQDGTVTEIPQNTNAEVSSAVDQSAPGEYKQTKESAVLFVTDMLNEFEKTNSGLTIEQRLTALDTATDIKGFVSDEALSYLQLTDFLKSDAKGAILSSQSLLGVDALILSLFDEIKPQVTNYENLVYLDTAAGTAFVSLDIFTNRATNFNFELNWIDGNWKFAPYSLISAISLSDSITRNITNSSTSN